MQDLPIPGPAPAQDLIPSPKPSTTRDLPNPEPPVAQDPIPSPKLTATQRKRPAKESNEVEEGPSKKRGRFVSNDPEARLRLERGKISGAHKAFMRNGLGMNPFFINGNQIKFLNICPFDALSELLRSGYVLSDSFRQYVDENSADEHDNLFKFLSIYARDGVNPTVYSRRAHILYRIFRDNPRANRNPRMLDCFAAPGEVLQKAVDVDFQAVLQRTCTSCFVQFIEPCSSIEISGLDVGLDAFTKLNEALERCQIWRMGSRCFQCHSDEVATESVALQPYLHIVVESWFNNYQCGLDDIPTSLKLAESTYILVGAIEFKMNIKHFVPFCRYGSGHWDERDDISSKPQRRSLTPSEIKKKRTFNSFMYVICNI